MTATLTEVDPLAGVLPGERVDRSEEHWSADDGILCRARASDEGVIDQSGGSGVCSRAAHPSHWKHIAASGSSVITTWWTDLDWARPDPFESYEIHQVIPRFVDEHRGIAAAGWSTHDDICGQGLGEGIGAADAEFDGVEHVGRGMCSRTRHPSHWKHIAVSDRTVIGIWRDELTTEEGEGVGDPEVSEPVDLTTGNMVRFKNRTDLMLVLGVRKVASSTGTVEVLDLTRKRFRVLRPEQLIARKPGEDPTAEQIRWVAEFMAERREKTRQVALNELRTGRFHSAAEVNSVLDELGLERHVARRQGTAELRVVVSGVETGTSAREAARVLREAVAAMTLPNGYKVEGTVRADIYHWERT